MLIQLSFNGGNMSIFKNIHLMSTVSRKPFSIISDNLPYSRKDSLQWYMKEEGFPDNFPLELISEALSEKESDSPAINYLKSLEKRKIFSVNKENPTAVVKGFLFDDSFSKKLIRHKLFAYDEATNLIIAKQRGLPVPDVYAFAQLKKGIFCTKSLVAMEYLKGGTHPSDIFRGNIESHHAWENVMDRVGKLILRLYYAGCNHIDAHGYSFIIDDHDSDNDKIIDFQYAVFYDQPMPNILSHHLSFMVRRKLAHFDAEYLDNWARSILEEAGNLDVDKQFKLYKDMLNAKELSSYKRMLFK